MGHSFRLATGVFDLLAETEMGDGIIFEIPPGDEGSFESMGHDAEGGRRFWWQSDLMEFLGYDDQKAFRKAVGRAMSVVSTLGLSTMEGFRPADRSLADGSKVEDCQLSRFACYLTAMGGNPNKPAVAAAQAYFAAMTEVARRALLDGEQVERMIVREEMTDAEKALNKAAKAGGVERYDFFKNEGYRGMYNMGLPQLRARKGIDPKQILFDYMGKQELAANLFRVTETEAKIRKEGKRGQSQLEAAAYSVGREVRDTMKRISGTNPEDLPIEEDINKVRSGFKRTARGFEKIDTPKSFPKRPKRSSED